MAYEIDGSFSCYSDDGEIFTIERHVFAGRRSAADGTTIVASGAIKHQTDDGRHVTKESDDKYIITDSGIELTPFRLK